MSHEQNEAHLRHFSALQDASELRERGPMDAEKLEPASRLIGYARRSNTLVDLAIERFLKNNQMARKIHNSALATHALAWSETAMAAAGGTQISRKVGAHLVELIEEDIGVYLVVRVAHNKTEPTGIEVRDANGAGARLALGTPIGGIIQLRLDLSKPDQLHFQAALAQPGSSVFLI